MSSQITVSTIATAFGCADNSYARVIADYRTLIESNAMSLQGCQHHESLGASVHDSFHRLWNMNELCEVLNDIEQRKLDELMAEFCHLYLPTFIRAFREAATNGLHSPSSTISSPDDHYFGLLCLMHSQPDLLRYIKDHPEAPGLLVDAMRFLSEWIRALISRLEANTNWWYEGYPAGRICFAFDCIRYLIFLTSPPTSLTPDLKSPAALALLQDLGKLRELIRYPPRDAVDVKDVRSLEAELLQLRTLVQGKFNFQWSRVERDRIRANMSWWTCEARNLGRCRVLKPGKEMMACGRCKAVRYYSPDHQKAHWKEHKKTCRAPIW